MLAHELRNPLAPMLNALALVRDGGDPGQFAWARNVLDRQVRHMARLVDDLLDVSRIARGSLKLRIEPVDLADVARRAAEAGRALQASRRHQLVLRLPSEPVPVLADAVRMEQVLMNLLHNAAKFTPDEGRIEVALRRDGREVELLVSDTGAGIDPETLSTIFDPLVQGDASLARAEGGLGIGLTLVRDVVRLHGGTVTAESEGPGQGSTFTVRLPAGTSTVAPTRADAPEAPPSPSSARVLVVDDNADAAMSLALLLRASGYEVEVAWSGSEALERVNGLAPDAAFLDIGLPDIDGYEVARRLRREHSPDLLLVALTGYGTAEDRSRSEAAGFDAHLVKPVDHRDVLALLAGRPGAVSGDGASQ